MAKGFSDIIMKGIAGLPAMQSSRIVPGSFYRRALNFSTTVPNDFKPTNKVQSSGLSLKDIVEQDVKENPVMIYMKGVPDYPQCGFSAAAVRVLKHYRCNMQRRPITTTSTPKNTSSALKLHVPPDVDDFLQECETFYAVKDGPLTCPLGWWKGYEKEDWCKEYGKTYESDEEKLYRFRVFKYNYEYMRQQNEFGDGSDRLAIDRSYDCSPDDVWEGGRVDDRIELPVVLCRTVEAWNEQLAKGQRNNKLIMVHFGSDWCRPCALMLSMIVRLVKEMPQVTFLVVDVTASEVKRVAEKLGVDAIPTVLLMKNGEVVDKVVGPLRDEVHRKITMHASSTASA